MKNKSRNNFKKTINKLDNIDNTFSDSNNINGKLVNLSNNEFNYNISSNELSFLIFSSNKDTNKYKRNVLFGNILSMSKHKDKISFNSLVKDSFKNSNININLDKDINNNHTNFFLTLEKNKIKNNEFKLNQLSSIKNNNFNTTIKRDYNNLFDNEQNFHLNLNDYLENDENIENNFSNDNSQKENISPSHQKLYLKNNSGNSNHEHIFKGIKDKDNKLETIIEERKKENNNKQLLNDGIFNINIKDKISKIKEDISNNNIKHKNEIKKININNNKYINAKLKKDKYIDFYELMYKKLEERDESKELENIFSEFFTEIKYKFWKKNSHKDFIYSLNNCKLYKLIKINNSNCLDTLISNMELSNNKNFSNSNSYFNNSKSELLRDGSHSHSMNDSSSQIIENQIEKNIPIISKFPKLMIPQSIIPEESSNFLYSNNDYILNRSFGEPIEENNSKNNILIQETEDEKNIIFEQNIKKELLKIKNNGEININNILDDLNLNHIINEEKQINKDSDIKEYKSKLFYNILIISQNNNINIIQKSPFSKIIKVN